MRNLLLKWAARISVSLAVVAVLRSNARAVEAMELNSVLVDAVRFEAHSERLEMRIQIRELRDEVLALRKKQGR